MYGIHGCRPDYTAVGRLVYTGVGLYTSVKTSVHRRRQVNTNLGRYTRVLARIHVSGPDSDQFTWVYAGKRGFRQVYTDVGQYYGIQGCTPVYTVVGLYARV